MENKKTKKQNKNLSNDKCSEDTNIFFGEEKCAQKISSENSDILREKSDSFCTNETENTKSNWLCDNSHDLCCHFCDYTTKKKCDYTRHMKSKRHLLKSNNQCRLYVCKYCEKPYKIYKSYWCHTNKCNATKNAFEMENINIPPVAEPITTGVTIDNNDDIKNNIINRLFLENKELRNFVVEQSKEHIKNTNKLVNKLVKMKKSGLESTELANTTNNNIINHNTINGNVTSNYNINLFLNDKCKDAVNFTEFIDKVHITNADLENNANSGFVNGISKILIDNLKSLSIYERPIHCTDVKKETMYIKDDHTWTKEEDDKKLKNAIQEISRKIMVQFNTWREDNPDYVDLDSEAGMKYVAITQNSVAGNNRDSYYGKIVKSIAKETIIVDF